QFFSVGRVCAGWLLSEYPTTTALGPEDHGAARTIISLQQLQRRTYRHDPRANYRPRSQPISAGKNLETNRRGISSHLEHRQRRGRVRADAHSAKRESDRFRKVRPALCEQRELGRQADYPAALDRRIRYQGSERPSSMGDVLSMAGPGRLLQVLLVGRFASRRRLQLFGHRHLWPVHFRFTQNESCDRTDG